MRSSGRLKINGEKSTHFYSPFDSFDWMKENWIFRDRIGAKHVSFEQINWDKGGEDN